jgi:hypothetical protein
VGQKFLALFSAFLLMIAPLSYAKSKKIQSPHGFDGKVYKAEMALYASSVSAGIDSRFICTVTVVGHLQQGYMLLGAGHCTSANPDLPQDLSFQVADDIGAPLHPVFLLKSVMDEPLDYAVYYYPTKAKYPVIELGSEQDMFIGDKTVDVNFSLGVTKMMSLGIVVSKTIEKTDPREPFAVGFFLVQQFDSHGASGSSVMSERTHKVIGLVIAGWDGSTMPTAVEPITRVEAEMAKWNWDYLALHPPAIPVIAPPPSDDYGPGARWFL